MDDLYTLDATHNSTARACKESRLCDDDDDDSGRRVDGVRRTVIYAVDAARLWPTCGRRGRPMR